MKVFAVVIFLFLAAALAVSANDFPEPAEIIKNEGRFIFTDGGSYYLFEKDGAFKSEPLGLSGRVITGTWKLQKGLFVIEGEWSWINGLSQKDDFRKMVLYINKPVSTETIKKPSFGYGGGAEMKIYKCYFLIEELQKIPKPQETRK